MLLCEGIYVTDQIDVLEGLVKLHRIFLIIPAAHDSTFSPTFKRHIMTVGPNTYVSVPRVRAVPNAPSANFQ